MTVPGREKPVVENPTFSTLEAYKDRVLHVVRRDGEELTGRLAVVNTGVAVFHTMQDGRLNPKGVFLENIASVQEKPKDALADSA